MIRNHGICQQQTHLFVHVQAIDFTFTAAIPLQIHTSRRKERRIRCEIYDDLSSQGWRVVMKSTLAAGRARGRPGSAQSDPSMLTWTEIAHK